MKTKNALSMVLLALLASVVQIFGRREECCNVNANVGTHANGIISLECETAALTRYKLVQKGTAGNQIIANVATTRPWGVVLDEPAVGDIAAVQLLGCSQGTVKMVANAAIAVGDLCYTAAAGKVSPTYGATLFLVGRAVTAAAADGDIIEVAHMFPLINADATL